MATSSSSSSHSYDPYLIPDTFPCPTSTPSKRKSSWETYLHEASEHEACLEADRCRMRAVILTSMKEYYGDKRWQRVETFEDGYEYSCDGGDDSLQPWADKLVVFGNESRWRRRRCCYFDRKGNAVCRTEFDKRRVPSEGSAAVSAPVATQSAPVSRGGTPRPGLVRRLTRRLAREA